MKPYIGVYPYLLVWILLFCLFPPDVFGQGDNNPYHLKWKVEVPVTLGGAGGVVLGEWMNRNKTTLSPDEIATLTTQNIPRFDRFATKLWSTRAQKGSDILLYGSVALPILLLADADMRKHTPKLLLIGLETYLINGALTGITKELVQRKRPFVYNPNAPMHKKTASDATSSFFSGHTSATAAATFMGAKMFADYHPHSPYKPYVWAAAALLPALTGYLRVRGGKHYLSDVLTGYAVGAAVGILVPQLHK